MIELVSGMPACQFEGKASAVRGSELVQGSSCSIRCFHLPKVCRPLRIEYALYGSRIAVLRYALMYISQKTALAIVCIHYSINDRLTNYIYLQKKLWRNLEVFMFGPPLAAGPEVPGSIPGSARFSE
jgi:hypothetical protein